MVTVHSEKERRAATFKGVRVPPDRGVVRQHQEMLAAMLRPGNAGSNTTADHIEVLTAAIAQVPAVHRKRLLVRADGAGASHGLLDWLTGQDAKRGRSVEYSVGFAVTEQVRTAIARCRRRRGRRRWTPTARSVRAATSPKGHRPARPDPLAGRDAGHHPPGTPPPRRPAVPVRARRRVALPSRRHQHRGRAAGVPRSPTPRPRPSRGPDPARQRLRPGPVPVPRVRHQPSLARMRHDRRRPDRLAAPPRPARHASRRASRRRCATGSCTSPPGSPEAPADDGCGCPRPGPGPTPSLPPSDVMAIPAPT